MDNILPAPMSKAERFGFEHHHWHPGRVARRLVTAEGGRSDADLAAAAMAHAPVDGRMGMVGHDDSEIDRETYQRMLDDLRQERGAGG